VFVINQRDSLFLVWPPHSTERVLNEESEQVVLYQHTNKYEKINNLRTSPTVCFTYSVLQEVLIQIESFEIKYNINSRVKPQNS